MKKVLILFALGILLLGCVGPEPEPEEQPTANYGDIVTVNYILTVDGKIIDTTIEEVARAEGIYSPFKNYIPLRFKLMLGEENPFITGFVKGIVGMKENESKIFTIPPGNDAYGIYDPTRVYNVSKYYNMSSLEVVPRSFFEGKNITIEEGAGFDTDIGTVFIEDVSGDNITIMYLFQPGDTFDYNGFHHVVTQSINFTYTIMLDVRENATYRTTSLIDGKLVLARVTKLTNDTITFDENHPLASKTLKYNVTLLKLEKATTESG